jgi:hypothetical protein
MLKVADLGNRREKEGRQVTSHWPLFHRLFWHIISHKVTGKNSPRPALCTFKKCAMSFHAKVVGSTVKYTF